VKTYTIVITADDDTTTSTTLRLDTSGGEVRLTDLHLHAGNGLPTGQLPAIDYGLLLQAIAPATPTPIAAAPAGTVDVASTPQPTSQPRVAAKRASRPTRTGRRPASTTTPAPAEPATSTRTRRAATAANRLAAAPNKSARMAKKAVRATPVKNASRAAGGGERAYRRMPADFAAVYRQVATAAAVADHYDVPRHTAHGWIRRLREQGGAPAGR
jgi:hypothetical protein